MFRSGSALDSLASTLNCKPHYLSGMNYVWGGGDPTSPALFFSSGRFADVVLDREALDETSGLGPGDVPLPPLFQTVPLTATYGYARDAATGLMVDWNFDGRYWPSVAAPVNFYWLDCATFHRGAGFLSKNPDGTDAAMNIGSTPAIAGLAALPVLGDVYYFFYAKGGRLYYRRQVRRTAMPFTLNERTDEYAGADQWNWSAQTEIAGLFGGGVTQLDAQEHISTTGERRIVVVYRSLAGQLAWLTVAPSVDGTSDVVVHRGRLRRDAANFASADASGIEVENFRDRMWLAYLWLGTAREMRLDGDLAWTYEQTMVDERDDPLRPSPLGIGLAAGPGLELLMLSGTPNAIDPRAADLEIRRFDVFDAGRSRWERLPSRLPLPLTTTIEPVIAFRPDDTHSFGGWYMVVYRNRPARAIDPLSGASTDVRITDGSGAVISNAVAKLKDEWTSLPEDSHIAVAMVPAVSDGEGLMGAFQWSAGDFAGRVEFMPYADGVSPTLASDHDDPAGIRYGLCYALRYYMDYTVPGEPRRVPRAECNPPPSRAKRWSPVPQTTVSCPGP